MVVFLFNQKVNLALISFMSRALYGTYMSFVSRTSVNESLISDE